MKNHEAHKAVEHQSDNLNTRAAHNMLEDVFTKAPQQYLEKAGKELAQIQQGTQHFCQDVFAQGMKQVPGLQEGVRGISRYAADTTKNCPAETAAVIGGGVVAIGSVAFILNTPALPGEALGLATLGAVGGGLTATWGMVKPAVQKGSEDLAKRCGL